MSPRAVGPLVADVGTLDEIQVSRGGTPAGGFRTAGRPPGGCRPEFHATTSGYDDHGMAGCSLSSHSPSATFRVDTQRLAVSNASLAMVATLTTLPVFWPRLRGRGRARGFNPSQPPGG